MDGYRSDVFSKEQDDSFAPRIQGNTYGAFFGAAKQGPVGWTFVSSWDRYKLLYGAPDYSISYLGHSVYEFFRKGAGAWVNRVVPPDAVYSGILLQNLGTAGSRVLGLAAFNTTAPTNVNFLTAGSANDIEDNILYIYPIGPGSAYNKLAIEIVSPNLQAVGTVTAAEFTPTADVTAVLAAGAYTYKVAAYNKYGEAAASAVANATVSALGKGIRLQWPAVPGASGYRIYRKLGAAAWQLINVASGSAIEYEDVGGTIISTTDPLTVSSIAVRDMFTLNVYDSTISTNSPVESFECSLRQPTSNVNAQLRVEDVVNGRSDYIRVVSNVNQLSTTPTITSLVKTSFTGGSSGSPIDASMINEQLDLLKDKDQYPLAGIVNCGYTLVSVQKKMVEVVEARKNGIAILDTPSNLQAEEDAVHYRTLTLGVNSSRGALFCNDHLVFDQFSNSNIYVPTSGIVMGLLAFTDVVSNPGYSPAGYNRGTVNTSIALRQRYSKVERDRLAEAGVNYFVDERGYGIVLKESYTQQVDYSALSFISVRRILDVAEDYTDRMLQRFLQEPNDEILEAQMLGELRDFYQLMVDQRMIKAFDLSADTKLSEVAAGNRNIYSYIEPLIPTIRIIHTTVLTKQGAIYDTQTQTV